MYNFNLLKEKIKTVEDHLQKELGQIRTGQATPLILDDIKVESYGTLMKLTQVASVSIEDSKTLRVSPWDTSQIKAIEKAIVASDLGLGTAVDEKGVRISFPQLTTERRGQFVKMAKEKLEQSRVSLRSVRDEVWNDIQKKEKEGAITEDNKFRLKNDMEKFIQDCNKKLDTMFDKKEKEILN
jgi:ribosome recycling factor